jgi:hypothetical protein
MGYRMNGACWADGHVVVATNMNVHGPGMRAYFMQWLPYVGFGFVV